MQRRASKKKEGGSGEEEASSFIFLVVLLNLFLKQVPTSTPFQMSSSGGQLNSPIAKVSKMRVVLVGGNTSVHQSRRKGNLKVELDQLPDQTVSRSVFLYFALGALRGKKDLRIADIHVE